jgi:predicted nucleic acid-binding protein
MIIEQTIEIPANRRIFLDLPQELPVGKAKVELTITPEAAPQGKTVRPLASLLGVDKGLDTLDAYFARKRADIVLGLLEQARTGAIRLSMSIVQLLEVYYDRLYISGEYGAQIRVQSILNEPINIIESISYQVMYEAGRFKISYSMSLADAIAAATARSLAATLVTFAFIS